MWFFKNFFLLPIVFSVLIIHNALQLLIFLKYYRKMNVCLFIRTLQTKSYWTIFNKSHTNRFLKEMKSQVSGSVYSFSNYLGHL